MGETLPRLTSSGGPACPAPRAPRGRGRGPEASAWPGRWGEGDRVSPDAAAAEGQPSRGSGPPGPRWQGEGHSEGVPARAPPVALLGPGPGGHSGSVCRPRAALAGSRSARGSWTPGWQRGRPAVEGGGGRPRRAAGEVLCSRREDSAPRRSVARGHPKSAGERSGAEPKARPFPRSALGPPLCAERLEGWPGPGGGNSPGRLALRGAGRTPPDPGLRLQAAFPG